MTEYSNIFESVKNASLGLIRLSDEKIQSILKDLAALAIRKTDFILAENQRDLERMDPQNPMYDRLMLNQSRIESIASEILQVSQLPTPLHLKLEEKMLPNGLYLEKVSVPLGVVGIIYEARPNVTFDVFSIALKSGNGLVLKGGSDADFSNRAIVSLIHEVLEKHDISTQAFQLLPPKREATKALLEAVGYVDVLIPRGSQGLINFVREHAKVPVIETGAGIVHTYMDETADLEKAKTIIHNAKTRRPSVCNSLDCLIIHQSHLNNLNDLIQPLLESEVKIYADEQAFHALNHSNLIHLAEQEHFGTEFLSLQLAIKTVNDLEQALQHIQIYSSNVFSM